MVCQINRKIREVQLAFQKKADSIGAANCRRELWLSVFTEAIKLGDTPETADSKATRSITLFDKRFPEVKAAAMAEDR